MKRNKRFNIFSWLSASVLLLTTACTDSADFNEAAKAGEEGMVTLTLNIQGQSVLTRAEATDSHISDGSQVDELIFAIYEKTDENGSYENKGTFTSSNIRLTTTGLTLADITTNQQMKITGFTTAPTKDAAISLKIPVDEGVYYKIVCWAQNSGCKAYTTTNLAEVQVSYKGANGSDAYNNDETRDAFCASEDFTSDTKNLTVVLKRPFAQINVGTAGWDYEAVAVLKPSAVSYTESMITLKGVADQYNVLTGEATASSNDITAEFAYARIPAFIHVTESEWQNALTNNGVSDKALYEANCFDREEFLKIDLNREGGIEDYIDWKTYKAWSSAHPTEDQTSTSEDSPYRTETFKYLSMCYVLVPETGDIDKVNGNVTSGSTLTSLEFTAQGYEDGDKTKPLVASKTITAYNVPVQKNWRTNIVSFEMFTDRTGFKLWVVPEYCGDHNNFDSGDEDEWHYNQKNGQFDTDNENYGWDYYSTKSTTQNQ